MNKIIKTILILITCTSFYNVYAEFNTNNKISNNFNTIKYSIKINANGGYFNNKNIITNQNYIILPTPIRQGYTFTYYNDENGNIYSNNISNLVSINNKYLYANWNEN